MNYKQLNRNLMAAGAFWMVNKAFAKHTSLETAILLSDLVAKEIYFEAKGQLTAEGFFFNTAENIESDTTIKRDKQKDCIDELEKLELIETCLIGLPRRKHFKINHQAISLFFSTIHEKPLLECPQLVSDFSASKPTPTAEASISLQPHNKDIKGNKNKVINNTNTVDDTNFDVFWECYPRKVAKGDARKAWKALKPTEELAFEIIESVKQQAQSLESWKKDNGKFIPYPATWLRAERWNDEILGEAYDPEANLPTAEEAEALLRSVFTEKEWEKEKAKELERRAAKAARLAAANR